MAALYLAALFGSGTPIRIEYVVMSPYIGAGVTIANASASRVKEVQVSIQIYPPQPDATLHADHCNLRPAGQPDTSRFDCGTLGPGTSRTFFISIAPERLKLRIGYKGGSLTAAYHRTADQTYSRDYYFGVPLP